MLAAIYVVHSDQEKIQRLDIALPITVLNGPFSASLYLISSFQDTCRLEKVCKICRCLDSNHGGLVSEATTVPTEPQPLPSFAIKFRVSIISSIKPHAQGVRA